MKKNKSKISDFTLSRRNFLKNTTFASTFASLTPLETFFASMIQGMCDTAHADELGGQDIYNYIHMSMGGGPARWMFDLPLMPNGGSDKFLKSSQMLITKFDNSTGLDATYAFFKRGEYYFPHLWSCLVPKAGGGLRPLSELLDHMITFRGVNLEVDGHSQNRLKQNAPIAGRETLNGLAADKSNVAIPAVHLGTSLNFKSTSGVSTVSASGSNPLRTLLDPFNIDNAKSFGRRDAIEGMIDSALASLSLNAQKASSKTKSLFQDRKSAKKLFVTEFGNLTEVYNQLYTKYATLIEETMKTSLAGISDREVETQSNGYFRMQTNGSLTTPRLAAGYDLRDTLVSGGRTQGSANRSISGQRNTTVSNLAASMALSEFVLIRQLSSSITLSIGSLSNLWLPILDSDGNFVSMTNRIQNNDQHASGKYTTMFHNSFYYAAIGACMLELFDSLKAISDGKGGTLFDKTLLHLSSEFNRSARANGTGSDHGWRGSNASIFSGMIKKPEVIGNIQHNYSSKSHSGSWGVAAPIREIGNRDMKIGHVSSSIAAALNMPSPTPNDDPFLKNESGVIKNYAPKPKNV